jgi:hypothetical protein
MLMQMKSSQRAREREAWARHRRWYASLAPEQRAAHDARVRRQERQIFGTFAVAVVALVLLAWLS